MSYDRIGNLLREQKTFDYMFVDKPGIFIYSPLSLTDSFLSS